MTVITRLAPLVVGWLAAWWMLWRLPTPRPVEPDPAVGPGLDDVAVVVPARDEARTLPILLASLADAREAGAEVVVVDDQSTDGTGALAAEAGAKVVSAPELPEGWAGKPHACAVGVLHTDRPTLVFLDADTELEPGGLGRIVAELRARGGLLSVQPYHRTGPGAERLAAIFNLVGIMGVGCASVRPRVTGAFGPCLATSRADYDAIGGHAAVRGEVLEDLALARRYRDADLPVAALGGRGSISFRMYPDGLGQLVEGFTKNFAGGAGSIPWWRALAVFVWITGLLLAGWTLPIQSVGWWFGGAVPSALAYAAYLAYALQLVVLLRRVGRFGPWVPWVFPLHGAAFVLVFLRSLVHTARGRTTWRGRTVRTRGA